MRGRSTAGDRRREDDEPDRAWIFAAARRAHSSDAPRRGTPRRRSGRGNRGRGAEGEYAALKSATIAGDVKFLRQAALLLPSAFLLDVLVFLLTHGRDDPGFGAYPFFQSWAGEARRRPRAASSSRPLRLLHPGLRPRSAARPRRHPRRAGPLRAARRKRAPSRYGRAFGAAFPALFFAASVAPDAGRRARGPAAGAGLAGRAAARGRGAVRRRRRRRSFPRCVAAAPLAFLWKAAAA